MRRYVNTPSTFLTPRDYYPNYDKLARVKDRWDPHEVFRIYQGIRPTGLPPDAYEFTRPYPVLKVVPLALEFDFITDLILQDKRMPFTQSMRRALVYSLCMPRT